MKIPITNKDKWEEDDNIYHDENFKYEELAVYQTNDKKKTIHEYVVNHQEEGIMITWHHETFSDYKYPIILIYEEE